MATPRNPKFLGVYSGPLPSQPGKKAKFFAWQLANATYAIQELDAALSARGKPLAVPAQIFNKVYKNEPAILAFPVTTPDFRQLAPAPASQTASPDTDLGQLEKARKARQLENDLRDAFSKALRALARPRDRKGAIAALERIAASKDGIGPAHRHMFRDFGVILRKKSMPELALVCAKRVVALSPNDDHARFNLARIHTILGQYEDASRELRQAMQLDPSEPVYSRMERHLARERDFAAENRRPEGRRG